MRLLSMHRHSRPLPAALLAATLAVSAVACADPPPQPGEVEILHWWTSGGEFDALRAMLTIFTQKHPEVTISADGVAGSTNARAAITDHMLGGHPPGTFQANAGWDLLQWVLYNNMNDEENKLTPIDGLAKSQDWQTQFPGPVLDRVRFGDHVYGVPLNVHRVNTLFYNKHLFDEAGVTPPTTLDELFTVAATFRARGKTPIALGTNDPWTLPLLLFENVLVARQGAGFYRDFFQGSVDALGPEMSGVVADFGRLLGFTNTNAPLLTWTNAVDLVRQGDAAMTIMGDWSKAYFQSKHDVPDVDFGAIPMPGSEGTFVFTTDTFCLPKESGSEEIALELLAVFGDPPGQDAFNPRKGSISPRMDADTSLYDEMAKRTIADFQAAAHSATNLVPATAIVAPPAYLDAIKPVLAQFAIDGNASVVLHTLDNWSDVLRSNPLR